MSIDRRLSIEKITPELINYIVEKIVREIQDAKKAIEAVEKIEEYVLKNINLPSDKAIS